MTTNPYESPKGTEDVNPPDRLPPHEKGCGSAVAFVLATIGGGLAGMVIGNSVALSLGLLPTWRQTIFLEIRHPLSLVLLVVGSLLSAYATLRIIDSRCARANH